MKKFGLTQEQIRLFRKNGFSGPYDLYEEEEIKKQYRKLRPKLFDRSKAIYELENTSVVSGYDRHLDVDFLSEHIMKKEIVHKVNNILGPNLLCWRSEMFPKYPGDEGTDWHQADTFAHASGKPQILWPDADFGGVITVWTALTDCRIENGCLKFIPGTQEEMFYDESKDMEYIPEKVNAIEKQGDRMGFFGYDYRNLQKDKNFVPDEGQAQAIEMKAGQFVIFWSTLMHASFPNNSKDKTRLGYACRYVPTKVKIYPETDSFNEYGSQLSLSDYGAVLVSGKNKYTHNRIRESNTRGFKFKVE